MVSEVEHISGAQNLKNSLFVFVLGIIMILSAIGLLFWNEGNAINVQEALETGISKTISVTSDTVDPTNEGQLIHTSGRASSDAILQDKIFGISQNALMLKRKVEIYQWTEDQETETKKKLGGGEKQITTYSYRKEWSTSLIKSSDFKEAQTHQNPNEIPYKQQNFHAKKVNLAAFELSKSIVNKIDNYKSLDIDASQISDTIKKKFKISSNQLYLGDNPNSPNVGDVRVTFTYLPATEISLVYQQVGKGLEPYYIKKNDKNIELLQVGKIGIDQMFQNAQDENSHWTWIRRLIGIVLMSAGFASVASPLTTVAGVIPFLGSLAEVITGVFSVLISLILSGAIISLSWLFYRPVTAIIIFTIITVPIVIIMFFVKKKKVTLTSQGTPQTTISHTQKKNKEATVEDYDDGFDI